MGELLTPIHLMVVAIVAFRALRREEASRAWRRIGRGAPWVQRWNKGLTDELSSAEVIPAVAANRKQLRSGRPQWRRCDERRREILSGCDEWTTTGCRYFDSTAMKPKK
jgi:hypothetical protein